MHVGNDIVDLRDPETAVEALHPRFDTRVFDPDELALLAASPDPHLLRWKLWSAKESCYKLARQLDPETVFSPVRFAVTPHQRGATVRHGDQRYAVHFESTEDWVHAVSQGDDAAVHTAVAAHAGDASRDVRALAARTIADALRLPIDEIEIQTEQSIPRASRSGEALDVGLSLAHHGRYMACAVAPGWMTM